MLRACRVVSAPGSEDVVLTDASSAALFAIGWDVVPSWALSVILCYCDAHMRPRGDFGV
jgi:hypothetical protein